MAECMVRNEIERIERENRWALRKCLRSDDDVALLNAQIALDARRVLNDHMERCPICSAEVVAEQSYSHFFAPNGHKRVDREIGNLSVLNAMPKGF